MFAASASAHLNGTSLRTCGAQEENLSACVSGISNCVSPANGVCAQVRKGVPNPSVGFRTASPPPMVCQILHPQAESFFLLQWKYVKSGGSNWIPFRVCDSFVDPISVVGGSNFPCVKNQWIHLFCWNKFIIIINIQDPGGIGSTWHCT